MIRKLSPISCSALACWFFLGWSASRAAVLVSTGFESPEYAAGNLPSTSSLPVRFSGTPNAGATIVSSPSPFGSSNQFLKLNANAGGSPTGFTVLSEGISSLTTYHFDLYEPTGESGTLHFGIARSDLNANTSNGTYTGWTINNGAIGTASLTNLASGTAPTIAVDRHYKAFVLYNGTALSQSLQDPAGSTVTLEAGQTALFFYDYTTATMVDGGRYETTGSVDPARFMFRSFSNSRNQIYVDNFTREDTLTFSIVPEPSALGLSALALGHAVFRRARRRLS